MSQGMRDLISLRSMLKELISVLKFNGIGNATVNSTVFEDNNGAIKTEESPKLTPRTNSKTV